MNKEQIPSLRSEQATATIDDTSKTLNRIVAVQKCPSTSSG